MESKGPIVRKLERHVFVCTNERPAGHPRGCCRAQGAEDVLAALKKEVAAAGLSASVRAQKAGCLDVCEYGTTVVVYPEGIWYGGVTVADTEEIVSVHLREGRSIERLRIPGK